MKSFFQLSEQVKRNRRVLREAGEQEQEQPQQPASALVTALQSAWAEFYNNPEHKPAFAAMKMAKLNTAPFDNMGTMLQNYAAQLSQQEKQAQKPAVQPAVQPQQQPAQTAPTPQAGQQ